MSTLEITTTSRMETMSDWMNPILVKECRQALKSRQFVATFMLLLISSWLICFFGVMISGPQIEYGSPSTSFFQGFFTVLSIATLIIVPFTSFRSLLTEQDSQTYELLSITTLSPRQIVWGKLLNSLVQVFVFYCAIAPFIAFTSLLQGFDLFRTIILLTSLLGISTLLCMFTLMLSTVARSKQVQTLSSLFIIGGLIFAFSSMMGMSVAVMMGEFDLDLEFFWSIGCFWLMGLTYFLLFMQITISQLMYESGNKATGVRLIATGQFFLLWLLVAVYSSVFKTWISSDMMETCLVFSIIHWAVFGFFVCMERDYLSRRIRREIPKRFLWRLLAAPFLPGGTRGFLLVLLNLGLLTIILQFYLNISGSLSSSGSSFLLAQSTILSYLVIYLGVGCAFTRNLLKISNELQPMHGRTMLIVMVAFGIIFPYLLLWGLGHYETYNPNYSLLLITNPIETLNEITSRGPHGNTASTFLMVGVVSVIAVNFVPMLKSVGEVLFPQKTLPSSNTL